MAIPVETLRLFPPLIRERGDRYFHAGRVAIVASNDMGVEAVVRGSQEYRVRIRLSRTGALTFECSCPFGRENGWCKHAWATLLEADSSVGVPGLSARVAAPPNGDEDDGWQTQVRRLGEMLDAPSVDDAGKRWPSTRRIVYILDVHASSYRSDGLVVEVAQQRTNPDGEWGDPVPLRVNQATWLNAPDVLDREVAQMLLGTRTEDGATAGGGSARRYIVRASAFDTTLRRMVETGRARLRVLPDAVPATVSWDPGDPWRFRLRVVAGRKGRREIYELDGAFARGDEQYAVHDPAVLMRGGLFVMHGCIHRFVDDHVFDVAYALRTAMSVRVPRREAVSLVAELFKLPRRIDIEIPPELGLVHVHEPPVPCLAMRDAIPGPGGTRRVEGRLTFAYGPAEVPWTSESAQALDPATMRVYARDLVAEEGAREALMRTGFRMDIDEVTNQRTWRIAPTRSERAVRILSRDGWRISVEGRILRDTGEVDLRLSTGIDWFELDGEVTFGEQRAALPELLAAVRRGDHRVALPDGSLGLMTDELFDRLAVLTATGVAASGRVRYRRAQAGILDALLESMPAVRVDEAFERVRSALQRFEGITPADPPPGFTGVLREYQREGLGWLHFLRDFGFGGCLADDMGLGKTVQALALLESRRQLQAGPSLVVVPSSLVFNWEQEARRFAPGIRVHVHAGPGRRRALARLNEFDLMLTTYGTLRRDAAELMGIEFDYVILDEAQAIKNPETDAAKAARLLRARYRLAMSGTPIENRLGELWSLLEFLNPGMLGSAAGFARMTRALDDTDTEAAMRSAEYREMLARAVRPYVLRRTKESVARDLPDKVEQTLYVDLGPTERKRYDELRDHYRNELFQRVDPDGMPTSRVHVLEALLRLRQAACHPGLMAPELASQSSSKLEVLESHVREAVAEGHKVLVFSQFTSFLAIVRRALDAAGIVYEYLDGKTRDREARVTRFQEDPHCPVFIISLKAGGLGLNLTAADYVFLLDPWWNPAVESQAIDRAHRIGQSRAVFATRLIARDTVEEKVLQLQASKRDLAEAIIRADTGPISSLTRDDLDLLLS